MRYSDHKYTHGIGWSMCHMEWVTKYRYKIFRDEDLKTLCLILLDECAKRHNFRIEEKEVQSDHVHVLISDLVALSKSAFMCLAQFFRTFKYLSILAILSPSMLQ